MSTRVSPSRRASQKARAEKNKNPNAKPGWESIFLGPSVVTLLSAAVLVTAMAFDRWYVTTYKGDISRIGLFKTCVGAQEDCVSNAFETLVSTPSCRDSGATWQSRSIATAALISLGLACIAASFVLNMTAASTRNMVYFAWATLLSWIGVAFTAAGGGVQYHFFSVVIYCELSFCDYAKERHGDNPSCSETQGMSSYLWFVALMMFFANAVGKSILCFLWRDRLSLTWRMMRAEPVKAADASGGNKRSAASRAGSRGNTPRSGSAYRADAAEQPPMAEEAEVHVPEGFVPSADYSPYYYSSLHNMLFDPDTSFFFDLAEERWIDPASWE